MNQKKIKTIFLIVIIVSLIMIFIGLLVMLQSFKNSINSPQVTFSTTTSNFPNPDTQTTTSIENVDCGKESAYIVSGSSLSGMIESGQKVVVIKNYYDCHPVQRDDIVAYNKYPGDANPIIKVVKAISGDVWRLEPDKSGNLIVVNGQPLKNSYGNNYVIPFEKSAMLALYVKSYPIIPSDKFLILGNQIQGTLDSTKFGFVGLKDVIGKVIK